MMEAARTPEVYVYIRTVMSMVIGLSLAQLLTRLAGFVQAPGKHRVYFVHLGWVLSMFLFIIHFWWWEYRLQSVAEISFGVYLFLICFCCLFYFLCVLLNPPSIEDYGGFEEYFISRRRWFFGLLAVTYAVDLIDTLLKGRPISDRSAGNIRPATSSISPFVSSRPSQPIAVSRPPS